MRRVDPKNLGVDQDNYFIHLARYMFCARQLKKKDSVLEIGCGTGYGSRLLSDYASVVYAVDKENTLSESWELLKKENLHFVSDIPNEKFDAVVSFEVVEHIPVKDLSDYFNLIKTHLNENGTAYISTPRAIPWDERSKNRQLEHEIEYTPTEFRTLLEQHFSRVFLFAQNDSIISFQNPQMAWNLVAICIP